VTILSDKFAAINKNKGIVIDAGKEVGKQEI
jgi:hypothetical protein